MDSSETALYSGLLLLGGSFFIGWLVATVFYLLTLQNTLKLIKPHNRRIRPGQVWLLLIPVFNLVWNFIVTNRLAESIHNENNDQKFSFEDGVVSDSFADMKERPTRSIGLAYSICAATTWVPIVGTLTGIASIVCWIMYWVQVNKCKKSLEQRQWEEHLSAPAGIPADQF